MLKAYEFCVPTRGTKVPAGPEWIHEIKHDGYRMMVGRDGDRVRLISRNGADLTSRYPWIVEAALKNRTKQFVIDGEAVVLGVDGVSDFDALQSRKRDEEVQLYAFDMLAGDGDDLRTLPLSMRKANLARLLARRPDGIFVAPFEQGEIGPALFRKACEFGLEGMVSKRRDRAYRGGRYPLLDQGQEPEAPVREAGEGRVFIRSGPSGESHRGRVSGIYREITGTIPEPAGLTTVPARNSLRDIKPQCPAGTKILPQ
jgi:bifunctional non-homologous end joining protein LigD